MSDQTALLRVYADEELGRDGYPTEWHAAIKHLVRERAGHRCERCGHPYRAGEHGNGEWSPCAWRYLGRDLDREETLARMHELLDLERIA